MAAANARNIELFLGLTPPAAELLATVLKAASSHREVEMALEAANAVLDAHGVEAIRSSRYDDRYYGDIVALYVNMGDSYVGTLLYITKTGSFVVTSWGDWVESNERRYKII